MKQAKHMIVLAAGASLLAVSVFNGPVRAEHPEGSSHRIVDAGSALLDVIAIQQSEANSCGEAAIVMAYNHANPAAALTEQDVIQYARSQRLYSRRTPPFTSPAAMARIGRHFAGRVHSGNAATAAAGLALLEAELDAGRPVIIDVTTILSDVSSGAHFVVVTGYAYDAQSQKTLITFNDPLSGMQRAAGWDGAEGIWNAWHNNGDPGGAGWWMVIPRALLEDGTLSGFSR